MPLSIRLDKETEEQLNQVAKRLKLNKTELIRKSLKEYLVKILSEETSSPYEIYARNYSEIYGSGKGNLSLNHREELIKRIKKRHDL